MKLLIASHNPGKIAELTPLLAQAGFEVTDARTHALTEPEETGQTFIANARIKAESAVKETGMAVLADDSGLVIDALGEFPGVDTKPHVDACGGYQAAVDDLFRRLDGRPADCHYVSVLILCYPDGREVIGKGKVPGKLLSLPRGGGNFGHDPWFYVEELGKTFAEISTEEKNALSHRSQAVADLLGQLGEGRLSFSPLPAGPE